MGCYNSIVVNAPVDTVWSTVRDFHDMSWAAGVIETCEAIGDPKGDQIGAGRVLNGVFHETLRALSDLDRTIEYSIDDGPSPISKDEVRNYIGKLRLFPVTTDGATFVEWQSSYEAADPAAVGDFCNPIYQGLLQALAARFAS